METPETGLFTTVTTDVPGVDACVLQVPEKLFKEDTNTSEGIALKDFMVAEGASKEDALDRGYGDYVLTGPGPEASGMRAYYFAKPRTTEESGTAYRSMQGVRLGIPWPAVFGSMSTGNLLAYDSDGTSYVQGTVWKPNWSKKFYDGPVTVLEEWFASHVPFTIPAASGMQPRSEVFDYGVGSYTLPECLHGSLTLSYEIGESTQRPAQTASMTFDATTPTTWPAYIVLQDGQTFEKGLYIRRRLKAFAPS